MNRTLTGLQPSKPPDRSCMTGAFHPPFLKFQPSTALLSPQPLSLSLLSLLSLPISEHANDAMREKQFPFKQDVQNL